MSDIVERLREGLDPDESLAIAQANVLFAKAADRIVALEGALAHAEREYESVKAGEIGWAKAAQKMTRQCEDMAMMIRRLVRRDQTLDKAAMDMLERFDMRGEPMRRVKK